MIRHIFKLIWNRKRSNFLMMMEIMLSFIVMFAVSTMVFYGFESYYKSLGFEYENVWILRMNPNNETEGLREKIVEIQRELQSHEDVLFTSPAQAYHPYSLTVVYATFMSEETRERFTATPFRVGDDYNEVMGLEITEGRWFTGEDDASTLAPILINRLLKEEYFGDGPALGKTIIDSYKVIGVVDNYRFYGELDDPAPCFFERRNAVGDDFNIPEEFMFRVRNGDDMKLVNSLEQRIAQVARGWTIGIQRMTDLREFYFKSKIIPIVILAIVAGFLIFNVGLGLFGVLWYSINRRRSEIGLRRALGANTGDVSRQIIGEALVMTTFGIILGGFIAFQVPVLGLFSGISLSIYILAIVCAAVLVYMTVSFCAFYPSRLAAQIHPATALHYE